MKYFAGIDPGQGGGLAVISADMQEIHVLDFPDSIQVAVDLLRVVMLEHHPVLTGIEKGEPCRNRAYPARLNSAAITVLGLVRFCPANGQYNRHTGKMATLSA